MPENIASVAQNQDTLVSSLAEVYLNVHELKSGLEAHGVKPARLNEGFMKLGIQLDHIEIKLDDLHQKMVNMNEEMKKITEKMITSKKPKGLQGRILHLTIPYANLRIIEEVGAGGFATVYRGTWQGTEIAYKEIIIDTSNKKTMLRQV
ncbi:hypothetical protein CYMTET_37237 [Cymbomonas tetramitiformis]|uniref:Protein kinase domain-containing protein n=1 Tax=Cymbomonas tetramitiformis TaxID=36881 RepID=A0AAE0F7M8_9CHLO|nr:hypothetical protein CYMTET_37237 [Cymbomonas tetramitiformis]